jgi:hypothetical protein
MNMVATMATTTTAPMIFSFAPMGSPYPNPIHRQNVHFDTLPESAIWATFFSIPALVPVYSMRQRP